MIIFISLFNINLNISIKKNQDFLKYQKKIQVYGILECVDLEEIHYIFHQK